MSYQRSTLHDAIPTTLASLKTTIGVKNNLVFKLSDELIKAYHDNEIMKAEDSEFNEDFEQSIQVESTLIKSLQDQLNALQADYTSGRINYIRYKDKLSPIHDFFQRNKGYNHKDLNKANINQILNSVFPTNDGSPSLNIIKSDETYNGGFIQRIEQLRQNNNALANVPTDEPTKAKKIRANITGLCTQLYEDFRQMKSDFESKSLNQADYFKNLDLLRLTIKHLPHIDSDALNENEINEECQRFKMLV